MSRSPTWSREKPKRYPATDEGHHHDAGDHQLKTGEGEGAPFDELGHGLIEAALDVLVCVTGQCGVVEIGAQFSIGVFSGELAVRDEIIVDVLWRPGHRDRRQHQRHQN